MNINGLTGKTSAAMEATGNGDDTVTVIVTECRSQTVALGQYLGARLARGTTVCLDGDLGAGKTALTTGLAMGVGCRGPVSSPTFTLLIEHEPGDNGIPLDHFDVYRLAGGEAFLELGFDEYLNGDSICVIEWSSRVQSVLPSGCLMIDLALSAPDRPDERIITLRWPGHEDLLSELSLWGREMASC